MREVTMAIEKSVFDTEQEVGKFVRDQYGYPVNKVTKVKPGSANCYKIATASEVFLLKEFQSKFDKEALINEVKICEGIKHIIPTSSFVKNKNDQFICEEKGHLLHMQYFIEGVTDGRNHFDMRLLKQEAGILGTIHRQLVGYELPDGFPDAWFDSWNKQFSLDKYTNLIRQMEKRADMDDDLRKQLMSSCEKKISLLEDYGEDYKKYKLLQKANSHGDYNNLQILLDTNQNIAAVIDFSSAAYLPVVWEIIRSYTYSAKECVNGDYIDPESLGSYIDAYLENGTLKLYDIANMAPFYYYHILRSAYGFNSNNKELLKFAIWRTRLCEYLSKNMDKISTFLCDRYKSILR